MKKKGGRGKTILISTLILIVVIGVYVVILQRKSLDSCNKEIDDIEQDFHKRDIETAKIIIGENCNSDQNCKDALSYRFLKSEEYKNKPCNELALDCWDSGNEVTMPQVCLDIVVGCNNRR